MKDKKYTLHFVVAAGMEYAIENLRNQGIDIHCSYTMKKGISEKYDAGLIQHKLQVMSDIESKLATAINETLLSEHHLGYGQAESLFCRKNKNVPNNVFPIMWWKQYADHTHRNTLFVRLQEGY